MAIIMAQIGSYVPATSFKFTAIDKIFTRLGASDRLIEGKSTFFVEMEETHAMIDQATPNSLLIVDELGRGTSTFDGVSLAYATLKFISEKIKCITLFSTHYHSLIEEFSLYRNIVNYFMLSEFDSEKEELIFKYKFSEGMATKSEGIAVAKMSGLPDDVLKVARQKEKVMIEETKNVEKEKQFNAKFNDVVVALADSEVNKKLKIDKFFNTLEECFE